MNNLNALILSAVLSILCLDVLATEISQEQMDAIIAACKQEAKTAVDPSIHTENCIDDKLEALQEPADKSAQGDKH